jgi:DNA-binding transcriptional LysR family regulator
VGGTPVFPESIDTSQPERPRLTGIQPGEGEMQELRHILAFRAVCRCGSFSEASRRLNITPAAVSRSIAKLEDDLGARLFTRTTRHLHLTEEGRTYLHIISEAVDRLTEAKGLVHEQHSEARGVVRISSPATFARVKILPALATFCAQHPGLKIEIVVSEERVDLVEQGLDLGVQFGDPIDQNYIVKRLYAAPVQLVASPTYLALRGVPQVPADLTNHDCLTMPNTEGPVTWELHLHRSGNDYAETVQFTKPTGRLAIFNQYDLIYHAAMAGLGIATADVALIEPELRSGALRIILPDYRQWNPGRRSIELSLVYPHRQHMALRVKLVKDFLIELGVQCAAVNTDFHLFAA